MFFLLELFILVFTSMSPLSTTYSVTSRTHPTTLLLPAVVNSFIFSLLFFAHYPLTSHLSPSLNVLLIFVVVPLLAVYSHYLCILLITPIFSIFPVTISYLSTCSLSGNDESTIISLICTKPMLMFFAYPEQWSFQWIHDIVC